MKRPHKGTGKKLAAGICSVVLAVGMMPSAALAAPTAPGTAPGSSSSSSSSTTTFDYTGTYSGVLVADGETVSSTGQTLSTSTADQNVALAENGGTLTISGDTFTKSGDDTNGDNCNFYGVNSTVLSVGDGSTVYISGTSSTSTSEGSNGYFATDGATIYANNDTITTSDGGNSRGLDATYSGTIVANLMTITTGEDHCATVATDRGGGYISVSNSELSTAGSGSPLLYSTGDIEADNVTGTATGSQIAGMEGLNRIVINDSELSSTSDARSGSDPIKDGVILYQSTSGDADTSTADTSWFEATDSTLSTSISSGAFFYVTNTDASIVLEGTELDYDSDACELLHASGNSNNWGTTGQNGADVELSAADQTLEGDVYCDDESTVALYLTDGSTWTGETLSSSSAGDSTTGAPSNVDVYVDSTSSWVVGADCTVGTLDVADGGQVVDADGNTVTIKSATQTYVEGTSEYTVTVDSYSTDEVTAAATASGASDELTSARETFDTYYGTSTTWDTNGSSDSSDDTDDSSDEAIDISGATISDIADQTYTGEAIEPDVTVTYDGTTLTEGTDYTVSYADNTDVGTATVTVTGTGDYTGTATATFEIVAEGERYTITKNYVGGDYGTVTIIDGADGTTATMYPYAGDTVTFRTSPDVGYTLTRMSYTYTDPDTGESVTKALTRISGTGRAGTNSVYSFTMPAADVTINATFGENHRTITKDITGEGLLMVVDNGDGVAASLYPQVGTTVRFKAIASSGYELTNLYYTVEGTTKHLALTKVDGTTNVYEFTMPNWNVTLHGVFVEE
jgi:hypothetical protein